MNNLSFKNGEILYDIVNNTYGVVLAIYGDIVKLDSDGNRDVNTLCRIGSQEDKGTLEKLALRIFQIKNAKYTQKKNIQKDYGWSDNDLKYYQQNISYYISLLTTLITITNCETNKVIIIPEFVKNSMVDLDLVWYDGSKWLYTDCMQLCNYLKNVISPKRKVFTIYGSYDVENFVNFELNHIGVRIYNSSEYFGQILDVQYFEENELFTNHLVGWLLSKD